MDIFLKVTAGVLITVIVNLVLFRQGKDFGTILIICVCCIIGSIAISFYRQIFDFIETIEQIGNLNGELISVILKSVGISLISEISGLICSDSGNAALGKAIQILSSAMILWLCIPLFTELLDLVENVLGYL